MWGLAPQPLSVPHPRPVSPGLSCGLRLTGGQTGKRRHLHLAQQQSETAAGGAWWAERAFTRRDPASSPGPALIPAGMGPHWTPRQEPLSLCALLLQSQTP